MSTADADAWAATVVAAVGTVYPWASQHVVSGPDDVDAAPERLNPAFFGSFDWHSCVHMLASGVTLLASEGLSPDTRADLVGTLDARLSGARTAVEAELLRRRPGFERPYGWAWALRLAQVCAASTHPHAPAWAAALDPVAEAIWGHLPTWLERLDAPVRTGTHDNTAFALGLIRDAAVALGRAEIVAAVDAFARRAYAADADYPVSWEPGGHDFLSAALCEATLLRRVLAPGEFAPWLAGFWPGLGSDADPLLGVPHVTDPTDGKAAHLLGLALSRGWHLRELAAFVAADRAQRMLTAADDQTAAVADHVTGGDFMATHWLVTYALMAELAR